MLLAILVPSEETEDPKSAHTEKVSQSGFEVEVVEEQPGYQKLQK